MARPPKPWYRTERGRWYVTIAGVKHDLGPDAAEAHRRFHLLMARTPSEPPPEPPKAPAPTPPEVTPLADLVPQYLFYLEGRATPGSVRMSRVYLEAVVRELSPRGLEATVEAHRAWGPQTRRLVYGRLKALYHWARKRGFTNEDPLRDVELPPAAPRGGEVLISPAQWEALRRSCRLHRPRLLEALTALYETGARPGELLAVTARAYDPRGPAWVLAVHKTARKVGRVRVILLTAGVAELTARLAKQYPDGPLFRSDRRAGDGGGVPYPGVHALSAAFRRARRGAGLPATVVLYSTRHTFGSDLLTAGTSDAQVAALLGHADTRMVHATYGHLGERARELRGALEAGLVRARGKPGSAQSAQSDGRPEPTPKIFAESETA